MDNKMQLFRNFLSPFSILQVDISVRNKNEENSELSQTKHCAIAYKKAVPNRLPNFDRGYEEKPIEPKIKTEIPEKEVVSNQNPPTKKNSGIKGMFDKQKGTSSSKTATEENVSKKDLPTNSKPNVTAKAPSGKGEF